jgi:beta-galactosidase
MKRIPMQAAYGAVYFRKSNPPKTDWERDYSQAAKDGHNIFRHWFMWSAIETALGIFDWEDYDHQMELAAKYGIRVIIAENISFVPEWLQYERPDLKCETNECHPLPSAQSPSSATGGFCWGLCLNKPEAKEYAGRFLRELAKRYRNHPALLGYDVWNECSVPHNLCYCPDTAQAFRNWLREKYGSLKELGLAWCRYSFTDWEQVIPPSQLQPYPECFDWLDFRKENAYLQLHWRIQTLRDTDPDSLICAHGMALSLENMAAGASDDWLAAREVDIYGLTFIQSRKGAEPWKQFQALDLTRAGARGKPFWHAEAQGGPLWLQPQVVGRSRDDGRIARPCDIRLWNLTSFAGGARGILYPRWRPLLTGPLFGAFAPYGMDGKPTPCSQMASVLANWANDSNQAGLMAASPVKGEVGIVVVPEAQTMSFLLSQSGTLDSYKYMASGAYRMFFDLSIQADFVHIDDIGEYKYLYLPYPLMLAEESVQKIAAWVQSGGLLVSEGCPGYFGSHGHAHAQQPPKVLADLFGAQEAYVEFTPDLLCDYDFTVQNKRVYGSEYLQTYQLTTGQALCRDEDGRILAVSNQIGSGGTVLFGTCLSKGYYDHTGSQAGELAEALFAKAGMHRHIHTDNNSIKVRLQQNGNDLYIWVLNPTASVQKARITLSQEWGRRESGNILWEGGKLVQCKPNAFEIEVAPMDALIFQVCLAAESSQFK